MYNLIITGLLISSFFMCLFAFRIGLKWGKSLGSGNLPEPIKTPVQVIKEHELTKEQEKQRAKEEAEFMRMLNYTGEPIKEEGEK